MCQSSVVERFQDLDILGILTNRRIEELVLSL